MSALQELEELQELVASTTHPRRAPRDRSNPLQEWDDANFFYRYRFTKAGFALLFDAIAPSLQHYVKKTNNPIPPTLQLTLALRYYATGTFQRCIGDMTENIHRTTVCKLLPRVTRAIASLGPDIIKYQPSLTTQDHFFQLCRIPGITGCVDGTLIPIQSTGGQYSEVYRSRKGGFSMNCQVVCNEKLEIMNIVTGYPGATHDARVWGNCSLNWDLEENNVEGMLLGDSAYPLRRFLMIPVVQPTTRGQQRYNKAHITARNCVERTIGVWKRTFPCMSKGLTVDIDKTPNIMTACGVLHNLRIRFKEPGHDENDDGEGDDRGNVLADAENNAVGRQVRDLIIARFE